MSVAPSRRRKGGESHYEWCMKEGFKWFVEQKATETAQPAIITCPPLSDMLDMAQGTMEKASLATKKKKEFRQLRKAVMGIEKSLREVTRQPVLKTTTGEGVTGVHMPLVEALAITSQYSGDWVNKMFQSSAEFDTRFRPLLPRLERGGERLVAAIKIIMDAVKAGKIAAIEGSEELEGEALTETRLRAFEAITHAGGVDAKAADPFFVAQGKKDIGEDLGDGETTPSSIADSASFGDLEDNTSNIQAMLKKERADGTGRRPKYQGDRESGQFVKGTPILRAFEGDFWMIARIADEAGDPFEMDKHGQTYGVLHQAVFWEDLDGVCLLTGRGLDPDPKTRRVCPTLGVQSGSTPLHLAAIIGNVMIVKQLICDGANVDAIDDDGKTPLHVAATDECKAAIEGAGRLRDMQDQFGVLVAAGSWDEAMKLIYAVEKDESGRAIHIGLPANTVLPGRPSSRAFPEGVPLNERYCAIHVAARQGNLVAYAQLVHAGAIPLQVTGHSECEGKLPSDMCDDSAEGRNIKLLVKKIEDLLAPGELDLGGGDIGPNGRYLVKLSDTIPEEAEEAEEGNGIAVIIEEDKDAGAPPASPS